MSGLVKSPYDNEWHSSDPGASVSLVVRTILSFTAVCIRLWCKGSRDSRRWFSWDDAFIVLALISSSTGVGVVLWGFSNSAPGNIPKVIENNILSQFIGIISDFLTLTFIRLSILHFYATIFVAHNTFTKITTCMGVTTILWSIAGIFAVIFMCDPVSHLWHKVPGGVCHNFQLFFLIIVTVEILIDTIILVMPIRLLAQLQLSRRTRISVIGIFLLGIFVVITNILRLRYTYNPKTHYADIHKATIWTCVHITSAFLCCCLPLCKPLLAKVAAVSVSVSQYALSLLSSGSRSRTALGSETASNHRNRDEQSGRGSGSAEGSLRLDNYESKTSVRVQGGETTNSEEAAPRTNDSIPRVIKVGHEFEVV